MIGILESVVGQFIGKGVEYLKGSIEFNRSKDAINERIARELRFNDELLKAILKHKKEKEPELISHLTESLQTTAFDAISDSSIPLTLFFAESDIRQEDWKSIQEKFPYPSAIYSKWASTIGDPTMLIERIYHRMKIIKLFSTLDISKNQQSIKYVLFLIRAYQIGIGKSK
jgi:hypothetical protein